MNCQKRKKISLLPVFLLIATISSTKGQTYTFPEYFKFGVATSAYQIEGAWNEDGKSPSVWDRTTHSNPSPIEDGNNADIACDSYHKWAEDVQMVKNLGVDFYRFSIAWTRILPEAYTTNINQPGVDYYNNLINALIDNGIEPVVTMYHWDVPDRLTRLGGLTNSEFVSYFENYARILFTLFGDRVKTWITFNEPNVFCNLFNDGQGDMSSIHPTGVADYLCAKNVLKAHAEAYHIYDKEFRPTQKGRISITLNAEWSEPASDKPEDIEAAQRLLMFDYGLWAHPIFKFDYPQVVIDRIAERSFFELHPKSRLPPLTFAEKTRIKGTFDFIGLNHYSTWLVADAEEANFTDRGYEVDYRAFRSHDPCWELTGGNHKVVPWGLRKLLTWIHETFNGPEILITECGYVDTTGDVNDPKRTNFYRVYLNATLEAMYEHSVRVTGFTAWSLMDNFEWVMGYLHKYGLYSVDFNDPNRPRTAKDSVEYYKSVITTRGV